MKTHAMFPHIFIILVLANTILCQINGEFWWLHKNVADIQNIEPPQPTFEEISEWETDESVKVVFKDNDLSSRERTSGNNNYNFSVQNKILPFIVFVDHTKLSKHNLIKTDNSTNKSSVNNYKDELKNSTVTVLQKENSGLKNNNNGDELEFIFPESVVFSIEDKIKNLTNTEIVLPNLNKKEIKKPQTILNDKVWFDEKRKYGETENICTFVNPHECFVLMGFIHSPRSCPKNISADKCKICCVLPLNVSKSRNPYTFYKRYKRSNPTDILTDALKQRNTLLLRKYTANTHQVNLASTTVRTKPVQKIVTPNDPYWNVKNLKFRDPNQQSGQNHPHSNDYEDYTVELPKPGLVGLYSDNGDRVTSWKLKTNKGFSYGGIDEDSVEDEDNDEGGFGYGTIDPRLGNRKSTKRHPQRLMTPSSVDESMERQSHTVHFHSTPDFRLLEGFKLVNLAENKDSYLRKSTTEKFYPSDEESSSENTSPYIITDSDFDYDDVFDINQQVFKNCGKEKFKTANDDDTPLGKGPTDSRCDPWIMVVVLTKNPQNILCYATIVHPRAAVTAASCVHGKATGDITAIAGVWDLNKRTQAQHRMTSIHVHPQFSVNDLANDLAILHWKRSLRLQPSVLPACLADPHVGDECYFVGWAGYDQSLKQQPQWQHASILTPRSCNDKLSSPEVDLPANAFCASVETRGTVTGVGGPLLCKSGDRVSVVGVAVYREDVVVLLPAYEWVTSALSELQIK